jgi:D-glycerate 3-kinase
MHDTVVDKSVEFVKDKFVRKLTSPNAKPLLLGIEGPQGSGKTTAATKIRQELQSLYPESNIVQFSMDDFYLTFAEQQELNRQFSDNILLQGRGLPGTHDTSLLYETINTLLQNNRNYFPVNIPIYDKSAHHGMGDRLPREYWTIVERPVDLIIFEGWFNGYYSIPSETMLLEKWDLIKRREAPRLAMITCENVVQINAYLKEYHKIWELFDLFVCIKTSNINNVYKWRLQQEHEMIKIKGSGMIDEDVVKFIDRYMPVYYLYYDRLELIQNMVESLELNIDESRKLVGSIL